jgi:TolB-like protein
MQSTSLLPATDPFDGDEVRALLSAMLNSDEFSGAVRMRKLLSYLVEMMLSRTSDLNEYMIGIAVFARHPATYNTGDDPIVRVQVGRLRARLRRYYEAARHAELELSIPLGSYMPMLRRQRAAPATSAATELCRPNLTLMSLGCLSGHVEAAAFTTGLHEQLLHQLCGTFGHVVYAPPGSDAAAPSNASHSIQGSVRLEHDQTRLIVRLVDFATATIVWSRQFDSSATWSIALQEHFAALVCAELREYFDDSLGAV